jgi:hypothetical protein
MGPMRARIRPYHRTKPYFFVQSKRFLYEIPHAAIYNGDEHTREEIPNMRPSLIIALALAVSAPALAGPLTPPGAPASTHKTLTEVEPRIPLNQTNTPSGAFGVFEITQPGSYYLADNLIVPGDKILGIRILAENVTIDLNGFTITGHPGANGGIQMSISGEGIVIRNGTIRDFSKITGYGIDTESAQDSYIENVLVLNAAGVGFDTGFESTLVNCTARACGIGFDSNDSTLFRDCVASHSTAEGFYAGTSSKLINCLASFGSSHGFVLDTDAEATGCISEDNLGNGYELEFGGIVRSSIATSVNIGVNALSDAVIEDVTVRNTIGNGIQMVNGRGQIRNCNVFDTGNWGIVVTSNSLVLIEDCVVENISGTGISASGLSEATVSGCTVRNTTLDGIVVNTGSTNSSVVDCSVEGTGNWGIFLENGLVRDCNVANTVDDGIAVFQNATVEECTILNPGGNGIQMGGWSTAIRNTIRNAPQGLDINFAGINPIGEQCLVDSNFISFDGGFGTNVGVVDGPGDEGIIVRNTLMNCTVMVTGAPVGTVLGPINDVTSPWTNFIQ